MPDTIYIQLRYSRCWHLSIGCSEKIALEWKRKCTVREKITVFSVNSYNPNNRIVVSQRLWGGTGGRGNQSKRKISFSLNCGYVGCIHRTFSSLSPQTSRLHVKWNKSHPSWFCSVCSCLLQVVP